MKEDNNKQFSHLEDSIQVPETKNEKPLETKNNYSFYNKTNVKKATNYILLFNILRIQILLIIILSKILPSDNKHLIIFNYLNQITLKIKGPGIKWMFSPKVEEKNFPELIKINGKRMNKIDYLYNFTQQENLIELNWNNKIMKDYRYYFLTCGDITEIDLSNFDSSQVTDMSYMLHFAPP